jgi:hypothetical protein
VCVDGAHAGTNPRNYNYRKHSLGDKWRTLGAVHYIHSAHNASTTITRRLFFVYHFDNNKIMFGGWSSAMRSTLRNQRSRVQIPVVNRVFVINSYTCSRVLAVYMYTPGLCAFSTKLTYILRYHTLNLKSKKKIFL